MDIKTYKIIFAVAATFIVAGAILYDGFPDIAPYIFSVGVALILFVRAKTMYRGSDKRIRRLYGILFFGTLLYVFAAYLMYIQSMYWVMALAVSAAIEFVVVFRMPRENKKEENN